MTTALTALTTLKMGVNVPHVVTNLRYRDVTSLFFMTKRIDKIHDYSCYQLINEYSYLNLKKMKIKSYVTVSQDKAKLTMGGLSVHLILKS